MQFILPQKSENYHQKSISSSKHWCSKIDLRQVPKLHLNHAILVFWTKVVKKFVFRKGDIKYHYRIQHILIILDVNVYLSTKRVFSIQSRENESHYRIKHIWINLSTKFHLKQTDDFQFLEQICPTRVFLI